MNCRLLELKRPLVPCRITIVGLTGRVPLLACPAVLSGDNSPSPLDKPAVAPFSSLLATRRPRCDTVLAVVTIWATIALIAGCRPPAEDPPTVPEPASVTIPFPPEVSIGHNRVIGLEVSGPTEAAIDEEIILKVVVANEAKVTPRGLSVHVIPPSGMELVNGESGGRRKLVFSAAGSSGGGAAVATFRLRASRPGSFGISVEIRSDTEILGDDWHVVTVPNPNADVMEPLEDGRPTLPDLGPPLVDDPKNLQRLDPVDLVWITRDRVSVVVQGQICQTQAPLETFACLRGTKEHESVVVVYSTANIIHAGLLATGIEPGNPVQFYPDFIPARGPEVEVTVVWKDEHDKTVEARGQDMVHNVLKKQPMKEPWVFVGSRFVKYDDGEEFYWADGEGVLIGVANFTGAVLDVPVRSSDSAASLLFEAFTENIPPLGTPVTLVLTPKRQEEKLGKETETDPEVTE
jgi:hypothetical protein